MTWLGVMALCPTAHATDRPRVALVYERGGTAQKDCPDAQTFRGLVAARLGYDPFVEDAPLALRVALRPKPSGIAGSLELTSEGAARGDRSMTSAPGDCYELVASLALAAAVAVDPESALAEHPSAETAPPATPPPSTSPLEAAPSPSTPPPSAPPPERTGNAPRLFLDAGALVSAGMQPSAAPGFRLGASVRGSVWSVGVEGAAFLASEREEPYGIVGAHALYGSLVPCAHAGGGTADADFCAALSLGALFSDAEAVDRSRAVTDFYATVGPRVGVTVKASEVLGFKLTAEAPVTLSRVHLLIRDGQDGQEGGTGREVWASSRIGFVGGASVVLKLR